jgi:hypothetical protein
VVFANPINNMDASELVSITISVPNGTLTHDNRHILCVYGNSWRTTLYIATFFAANYAAHAATIKSAPGDKTSVTVCNIALALLFPVSGLMRAVNAIVRFGRLGGTDLEKACRAGALCMVVRVQGWAPAFDQTLNAFVARETWTKSRHIQDEEGEQLDDWHSTTHDQKHVGADLRIYRPAYASEESSRWLYFDAVGGRANVNLAATKVHGTYSLPQGYGFAVLPRDTRLVEWTRMPDDSSGKFTSGSEIASTYSLAKAAISIIQTLAAFTILLDYRQDVIQKWGYASFHLTMLPYLVMTIFNFAGNICTADYDCLYLVETSTMEEARQRGGAFHGTVAATYTATKSGPKPEEEPGHAALKDYNGLDDTHVKAFATRFEEVDDLVMRVLAMINPGLVPLLSIQFV